MKFRHFFVKAHTRTREKIVLKRLIIYIYGRFEAGLRLFERSAELVKPSADGIRESVVVNLHTITQVLMFICMELEWCVL